MRNIFLFIRIYFNFLFFLLLMGIALFMLFNYNRYHHTIYSATAGEITGQPIGDDGLTVLLSGREWFDGVLILLFGLNHPLRYRGQALDRFAFIPHERALGKALRQRLRLTSVRRTDISSDRSWKIGRHVFLGLLLVQP